MSTAWSWAMVLTGLSLVGWTVRTQQRVGNPWWPGRPPRVLVDEGPFAFSRQPLRLGLLLCGLGLSVAAASVTGAALLLAWLLAVGRWRLPREEALQAQRFGGWWRDYAARVRRWV